jgi:hypothetical protein
MSTALFFSFFFPQTLGVAPLTLLVSAGGLAAASKRPFLFSATAQMPERSSKAEGKGFNRRIERQNTAPAIFLVVSLRMCLSDVPFIFYLFRLVRSS